MDARPRARARARRVRPRDAARRRCPGSQLYGPMDRGPPRRRRAVQPAGHPPARRGAGARPVRDRHPCRPPLHEPLHERLGPGGHRAGELQRLLDPRGHRRLVVGLRSVQRVFDEGAGSAAGRAARSDSATPSAAAAPVPAGATGHWSGTAVRLGFHAMDDLYRDYILEHSRRPHNFGASSRIPSAIYEGSNPLCGDRITLMLQIGVHDGIVERVGVHRPWLRDQPGQREPPDRRDRGKPLTDVEGFRADDLLDLLGIEISPARLKCAHAQPRDPAPRARRSSTLRPRPSRHRSRRPDADGPLHVYLAGLTCRQPRPRGSHRPHRPGADATPARPPNRR